MTIGAILTQGLGGFGTVNLLPTLGYLSNDNPPPPPTPVQQYSGGWFDTPARKRKTKAELRLEREEWGVLPKKAKALIKRVAAQQVEVEEPDNTEALIAAFNRAELAFKEEFRVLYRREIERKLVQMREEEEILLLLH